MMKMQDINASTTNNNFRQIGFDQILLRQDQGTTHIVIPKDFYFVFKPFTIIQNGILELDSSGILRIEGIEVILAPASNYHFWTIDDLDYKKFIYRQQDIEERDFSGSPFKRTMKKCIKKDAWIQIGQKPISLTTSNFLVEDERIGEKLIRI